MTYDEAISALYRVAQELRALDVNESNITKGGYFHIGNVAIKIAEITELK
jgi:hypothetical protein